MNSYLELSKEDQLLFCQQAQATLGFLPTTVEKDFWVCWTLRELFNLPVWGPQLTFKGGTSLSKAWKLIQRFSEDIDVVIDRDFLGFGKDKSPDQAGSKKQVNKRLDDLKSTCSQRIQSELLPALQGQFSALLPAGPAWSLEMASPEEDPDEQTILFKYPTVFPIPSEYVRPVVKIELGARSDHEPSAMATITPFLAEVFPQQFPNSSFEITTMAAERTFLEKAMLVHEETFRAPEKPRKKGMARHYFDLWSMITQGVGDRAIQDPDLFEQIADHRKIYFKWSWVDYETLKPGTMRMMPLESQIAFWQQDYAAMSKEMFAVEGLPEFAEIMKVITAFQDEWNGRG